MPPSSDLLKSRQWKRIFVLWKLSSECFVLPTVWTSEGIMASHPYISGAGNVAQMIGYLRKNFPATVNSETVRKLGVAPKNESYVINALQFIGLIDGEGIRTDRGQGVLTMHDEEESRKEFGALVQDSYRDLFDLRGDDAWTMNKNALIGYFRSADKTVT